MSASQLLTGAGPTAAIPRDGTLLGGLFESLAALSIRTFAQSCEARVPHLRTKGGLHEVDFVVEADGGVVAFEVKLSASINDRQVSHLHWLPHEDGDNCIDVVVLNTGPEAYRRRDGVAVVPLAVLPELDLISTATTGTEMSRICPIRWLAMCSSSSRAPM